MCSLRTSGQFALCHHLQPVKSISILNCNPNSPWVLLLGCANLRAQVPKKNTALEPTQATTPALPKLTQSFEGRRCHSFRNKLGHRGFYHRAQGRLSVVSCCGLQRAPTRGPVTLSAWECSTDVCHKLPFFP